MELGDLEQREQELVIKLLREADGDLSQAGFELSRAYQSAHVSVKMLRARARELHAAELQEQEQRLEAQQRALAAREAERRRSDPYAHLRTAKPAENGEVCGGWSQLMDPFMATGK